MERQKDQFQVRRLMLSYNKARWGLIALALALPLLAAMLGVHVNPLDEVGGGVPI